MEHFFTFVHLILALIGLLLLVAGVRIFKIFLCTCGLLLSFYLSSYARPYLSKFYHFTDNEYFFMVLGTGILIGLIFYQGYKVCFYIASVFGIYYFLSFYSGFFQFIPYRYLLLVSSILGGLGYLFLRKLFTIVSTAALGALLFTMSLPSLELFLQKISVGGFMQFASLALNEFNLNILNNSHPLFLIHLMSQWRNVTLPPFFSTLPLALTLIGIITQLLFFRKRSFRFLS